MCSSENELIQDVRQVHLEDMIMKNEEQFVMVRLPLTDTQVDKCRESSEREMAVSGDDRKVMEAALCSIADTIPPCADVETVGWISGRNIYFDESVTFGNVIPTITSIPLVRRTDMEAQVAKVAAEKDAEIVRLRKILDVFSTKLAECGAEGYDLSGADCVDLLNDAGVIEWGTFDPDTHESWMFDGCAPGDPIWTLKGSIA